MEGFSDVEPISLDFFKQVWPEVHTALLRVGLQEIELIGTAGKKPVMGDIDVAVGRVVGGTPIRTRLEEAFGTDNVKTAGSVVCLRYHYLDRTFQVDIMEGNPKYLSWSRFGSSQDPNHPDFSHVKSVARNILLNIIARFASEKKWPMDCPISRARMTIDWDRGLYEVSQTKQGKNGKVLKDWRTTVRFFVSGDPDEVVRRLFGRFASAQATRTFEGVVETLHQSARLKKLAPQILQTYAVEMKELSHLLGDEPEKALAFIDATAKG